MLSRALVVVGSVVVLGLGITFAEASPPAKPAATEATQGPKAQEGEACKNHGDCAQDKKPLSCVKSKCTHDPKHVPPPT